jgi:hypothetical protein
MKKSVMFLAVMMTSSIIFAQRHQGDPNGTGRSERLKKELSLSDDQYSKVKAIKIKFAERQASIRKDTSLTQGMAQKQMKNLRSEQETELKSVLTADQWNKYAAMRAKRGEARRSR